MTAKEIAAALSVEEIAVLRVWAGLDPLGEASDYPRVFSAEESVMERLHARGLFHFYRYGDPVYGPIVAYGLTGLGHSVADLLRAREGKQP